MLELLVALLPPAPGQQWERREIAAELAAYGYAVRIVPELDDQGVGAELDAAGAWVAHCALDLSTVEPDLPVLLVAHGQATRWIPAVGFAASAGHRLVVGYVLVEGELPRPGFHDWPDAPVAYIGEREATLAGLRGWDVMPGDDMAGQLRRVAELSL